MLCCAVLWWWSACDRKRYTIWRSELHSNVHRFLPFSIRLRLRQCIELRRGRRRLGGGCEYVYCSFYGRWLILVKMKLVVINTTHVCMTDDKTLGLQVLRLDRALMFGGVAEWWGSGQANYQLENEGGGEGKKVPLCSIGCHSLNQKSVRWMSAKQCSVGFSQECHSRGSSVGDWPIVECESRGEKCD